MCGAQETKETISAFLPVSVEKEARMCYNTVKVKIQRGLRNAMKLSTSHVIMYRRPDGLCYTTAQSFAAIKTAGYDRVDVSLWDLCKPDCPLAGDNWQAAVGRASLTLTARWRSRQILPSPVRHGWMRSWQAPFVGSVTFRF